MSPLMGIQVSTHTLQTESPWTFYTTNFSVRLPVTTFYILVNMQTDVKDYFVLSVINLTYSLLKILKERREKHPDCHSESCLRSCDTRNSTLWICFLILEKCVCCVSKRCMMVPVGNWIINISVFTSRDKLLKV